MTRFGINFRPTHTHTSILMNVNTHTHTHNMHLHMPKEVLLCTYSLKIFHLLEYIVNAFFGQVQLVKSMQSKHIFKTPCN